MKFAQLLLAITISTATLAANAGIVSFDGADKIDAGSAETGTGQSLNGTEPVGDPITFTDFTVSAGLSSTNLAFSSFNRGTQIDDGSRRAYQDWGHAGLGAVGADTISSDNLDANVGSVNNDEVLFFDFGSDVTLSKVWFNGGHQEDSGAAHFNIFYSDDNITYTSVFGGGASHQNPAGDFLLTGLSDTYRYFAVASTGTSGSPGGYVEAIDFAQEVPTPGSLALFGLGLAGLGLARRKQK